MKNTKTIYKGDYNTVGQKILNEYRNGDVELVGYFDAICPDLTIEEQVRLFAELKKMIDGDDIYHFIDNTTVIDLADGHQTDISNILAYLQSEYL